LSTYLSQEIGKLPCNSSYHLSNHIGEGSKILSLKNVQRSCILVLHTILLMLNVKYAVITKF